MLFDDSERIKKRLFHFLWNNFVPRNVLDICVIPIKLCDPRAHLSLYRYQGIFTTTILWFPFNSSSSFSNCTR